jgi:hypothetical protein
MPTLRKKNAVLNINSKATLRKIVQIGKRREINLLLILPKHTLPTFSKQHPVPLKK